MPHQLVTVDTKQRCSSWRCILPNRLICRCHLHQGFGGLLLHETNCLHGSLQPPLCVPLTLVFALLVAREAATMKPPPELATFAAPWCQEEHSLAIKIFVKEKILSGRAFLDKLKTNFSHMIVWSTLMVREERCMAPQVAFDAPSAVGDASEECDQGV